MNEATPEHWGPSCLASKFVLIRLRWFECVHASFPNSPPCPNRRPPTRSVTARMSVAPDEKVESAETLFDRCVAFAGERAPES